MSTISGPICTLWFSYASRTPLSSPDRKATWRKWLKYWKLLTKSHEFADCFDLSLTFLFWFSFLSLEQNEKLDWFPRLRAMSLSTNELQSDKVEMRAVQKELIVTQALVSKLSDQLAELQRQVQQLMTSGITFHSGSMGKKTDNSVLQPQKSNRPTWTFFSDKLYKNF